MTLSLADIAFLASPSGERLLERLTQEDLSEANVLRLLTTLRRDYVPEETHAALEMARLRLKAVDKFGDDAPRLFFTREALEQASDPLIRIYRAGEIVKHSKQIADAGCGIGADSLAFARQGMQVVGLDIDPQRLEIARYNAAALGLNARFELADLREKHLESDSIFFDPARRDEAGKRIFNVEAYQPPLSTIRQWRAFLLAVKLSPGIDLRQVSSYSGGVEFISVEGELKEAVLWIGAGWNGSRATLLTPGGNLHWNNEGSEFVSSLSKPRLWLVEPDPSLLRAGLVQDVAARFAGALLDETIAYFTTDERPASPWVRAWEIRAWMSFNLKKLRAYLRDHQIGLVTVKKRGSAITPEELIPQLKLKGTEECVLVLTRCKGQHIVIVCSPYDSA